MPGKIPINDIADQLKKAEEALNNYCSSLSDDDFFRQPGEKWSVAQQVKHLTTATNTAALAFTLPKFMVRWVGGRPNRPSKTYDALVEKYKLKLSEGGKASARYIPKPIPAEYGKEKILNQFSRSMHKMSRAVKTNWKDNQPDHYIAPHPLLGKITLRELCYFTIHHTYHHLDSIRNLTDR